MQISDLRFSYYGDDFTGSTDVLEALASNGIPTVLFPCMPEARHLVAFADCQAIGIAGESRSRDPQWMSENLPGIFSFLKTLGAPMCLYKVCSTFDSSPKIGSIGRALEIGQDIFGGACVPIVVAAPHLQRYVLFGNLFAAAGQRIYRIDHHPTMRHHPITPMTESDLRLHLAQQTPRDIGLLDVFSLRQSNVAEIYQRLAQEFRAVVYDGLDQLSLRCTGSLLDSLGQSSPQFIVGSSGAAYALIEHWRASDMLSPQHVAFSARRADRLLVLSGSCSPVTEKQILCAMANGFVCIAIYPRALLEDTDRTQENLLREAVRQLAGGTNVVLYSALGPQDISPLASSREFSVEMGKLLRNTIQQSGVRRVVVAGGDTSSHAVQQLGLYALRFLASLEPGAPLCRAYADDAAFHGLELVLKGGQVGPASFFQNVLRGHA